MHVMHENGADVELLQRALLACEADRRTGVLRVNGEPGGTVYLTDGGVTAIETPGAPGAEVILLRSGRVPEASWAAAFTAGAGEGRIAAELIQRGLIGAGELEAILRIAVADAMFALATGMARECVFEQAMPCLLGLEPPATAGWLLSETFRRLEVVASAPGLVHHDRDRVTADPDASAPGAALRPGQDEIVALANGRRTARDLAFILGRGVYALSLELTAMHQSGLVAVTSRRSPRPSGQPDAGTAAELPRRNQAGRQPRPGPAEVMPPASSALHRLLRMFPAADRDTQGPADAGTEL